MSNYKLAYKISGWATFAIAFLVYFLTVQRTGSLWDVGEFTLGAYKLQVVHPPGAPLFILIGRLFALAGDAFSENASNIAFMVNLLSGLCAAFASAFGAWIVFLLGKLALVDREGTTNSAQNLALMLAGIAGGLATAFCISVWFSAVEGEVYAMSFFFTALTVWAMTVWYAKPHGNQYDKWILFALYAVGLSTGVHLLSLLTLPAVALFYYFKRYEDITPLGLLAAVAVGGAITFFVQKVVIVGLPTLWYYMDMFTVNSLGLPVNSGIIPTVLIVLALIYFGLRYAHKKKSHLIQMGILAAALTSLGFSTIGVVVIRANTPTPVNMNTPSDPSRLLPYINREQYGERPILYGPQFNASPESMSTEPRYGFDGEKYSLVDYKVSREYKSSDKVLFPRMGHNDPNRKRYYQREWMGRQGEPTFADNISFFIRYQINWMYWRYFLQNFVGRLNAVQGYTPANVADGQWYSGIGFIDGNRLYNMDKEPDIRAEEEGRNAYYFLPLIFGIIGMVFLFGRRRRDFFTLLLLFLITGLGIIVYSNQPPHEPRERDYVLVGSFFTFAIFIGMAVLSIFEFLREKVQSIPSVGSAALAGVIVLTAPVIMAFQNYDDMGRQDLYASRDYAANFLNSVDENAVLFTYGDNDTYPLWYAQEVENIRPDVRVVNLSLISVDWYIDLLRHKVNDSPPLDLTLSRKDMRGYKRNQVFFYLQEGQKQKTISAPSALKFIASDQAEVSSPQREMNQYLVPANRFTLPVDKQQALQSGWVDQENADKIADQIVFDFTNSSYLTKDELALMDIITNNAHKRPIYYALTVQKEKLLGLSDYMQIEGLAMKVVPIKTPSKERYSIFGSGRLATDKILDNINNKFKWGNFDKEDQFVDESFQPAIQAHRTVMMRTIDELLQSGQTEKAANVADTYFEGFPNMNFPFGYYTTNFVRAYIQNGDIEKANKIISQLVENIVQREEFFASLDQDVIQSSFRRERSLNQSAMSSLYQLMSNYQDQEMKEKVINRLSPYMSQLQG